MAGERKAEFSRQRLSCRMRIQLEFFGLPQDTLGHFTCDRRELIQKFTQGFAGLKVFKQDAYRYTGANKHRGAA